MDTLELVYITREAIANRPRNLEGYRYPDFGWYLVDPCTNDVAGPFQTAREAFSHPSAILPGDWPEPSSYCAICGEESGGRGTSLWQHCHKWGPTTHHYKHTPFSGYWNRKQ